MWDTNATATTPLSRLELGSNFGCSGGQRLPMASQARGALLGVLIGCHLIPSAAIIGGKRERRTVEFDAVL